MIDREKINRSLDLRRRLYIDGDSPPFITHVEMMYPDENIKPVKILSFWKKYVKKPNSGLIDFYIHIPFCYSRCSYCTCYSNAVNLFTDTTHYVDKLIRFLSPYKKIFWKTTFRNLYIGGGTPSILKTKDLDRLLKFVFGHFKFKDDGGKCCEMNPLSATKAKILLLKKYNFDRVSFGVQSLDPEVLRYNNRGYQKETMVEKAVTTAKRAGLENINLDMILGLCGDNQKKFLNTFRKILKLKPATLSVYSLQPTDKYINDFFEGNFKKFYSHWNKISKDSLNEASEMAGKAGYTIPDFSKLFIKMLLPNNWNYIRKDLAISNNCYIGKEPNLSIFGVGDGANSSIDGKLTYKTTKLGYGFKNCLFEGAIRTRRVEMIDYISRKLGFNKCISLSLFKNEFHVDLTDEFKSELNMLSKLGAIKIDKKNLYLKTEDRKKRFLYTLLFYKDSDIINRLKKYS